MLVHVVNGAYLLALAGVFLVAWPRTRKAALWTIAGVLVVGVFVLRAVYARSRGRERPALRLPRRYRPAWARPAR